MKNSAQEKNSRQRKPRPLPIRILRWVLFIFLTLVLLICLVFAGMLIYFTPQRIENLAENLVQDNLHRPFQFEAAHISLLDGFVFKDIALPPSPDSLAQNNEIPLYSFYANEISLRYSLRQLLHRKFIITSALIDSPRIALRVLPVQTDSTTTPRIKSQAGDSLAAAASPIALQLRTFRLRNAQITVDIPDSNSNQHLFLSDLSCTLRDIETPNGDLMLQQDKVRGRFNLRCDNSDFAFAQQSPVQSMNAKGKLDADMDLIVKSLQYITLQGVVSLNDIVLNMPDLVQIDTGKLRLPIRGEMNGVLDAVNGQVDLPHVALFVDDVSWADLQVGVKNALTQPIIDVQVQRSRIPAAQLIRMAAAVAPDSLMPDIYLHDADAFLSLAGTEISGPLPDTLGNQLTCAAKLHLRNFGLTLNQGEYLLQNLNFTSSATFKLGLAAVHDTKFSAAVDIDSLAASLPDSMKAFAGRTRLTLTGTLNDDLLPASLKGTIEVADLLGANLTSDFSFGTQKRLDALRGAAHLKLSRLDPSVLAPSPIRTTISAQTDLELHGLRDIRVRLAVDTDSLLFQQDATKMAFAPIAFTGDIFAGTDTLFQDIRISKIKADINDFVSLDADASAHLGEKVSAILHVTNATLRHRQLLAYLPEEIQTAITGLNITGTTSLTLDGRAGVSATDTTFHVNSTIQTHDLNVDYLRQFVTLNGVNVTVGAELDADKSGRLSFDVLIDSTKTSNMPQSVFYNNHFLLAASVADFSSLNVDSGLIDLPDLKTHGSISAKAEIIGATPIVTANVRLHQAADDTIFITRDILYSGRNDLDISVHSDTAQARLSANIRTTDLTVSLPNDIRIDRINSDISVAQAVDIVNGALVADGGGLLKTPSGSLLDYSLYRDYYSSLKTRKSIIRIRKITAAGYVIENAHVEAFLGNGRVDVPYMTIDLYGGNIGGAFSLAANVDDLMDSPYKLSAHFSGINSALLLPTQQEANVGGRITAHAELQGRGFDIEKGIELDGYFHITKIESRVADNLLRSLDPEGKDSGIRSTRLLINRGFKPRLLTFDIRHGYSYPAIYFDQPWYFPVRLSGGGIELGRIPIAFFLQQK